MKTLRDVPLRIGMKIKWHAWKQNEYIIITSLTNTETNCSYHNSSYKESESYFSFHAYEYQGWLVLDSKRYPQRK